MKVSFRLHRGHIAFGHDLVMAALSFLAAVYLRTGEDWVPGWGQSTWILATGTFVTTCAGGFLSSRMYKGVWRYASVNDLLALVRGATIGLVAFYLLMFLVTRLQDLPRSVLVINWFVLIALLGGPRFLYRSFKDHRRESKHAARGDDRIPVLLLGAGDEADLFIRAARAPDAEYRAVGLVSDGGTRVGRNIHGIDVLGALDELDAVVTTLDKRGERPHRLIITDHRLDGAMVRRLLDDADRLGLSLGRMPRLTDLKEANDKVTIRPIAVEDLLGRPQAVLDREGVAALVAGKSVLVTGAGGSIGSELVRQICDLGPSRLVMLEASEFNLYSIDLELSSRAPRMDRVPVLGDVRDAKRISQVMRQHNPDLVFHAAALKHVPMVEWNPDEGLLTNAVGTRIVADACREAEVKLMVLISTDKAVNPTNVMGASKRVAEMYAQAMDLTDGPTHFVTVRFGNVLGSTGSVVPLFQKQLAAGGPLTVTHPDITRFFMTVREAVELVLQASALGLGSAAYRGKLLVLDMGEPVKIIHLANQMIRLAGLRPGIDIKVAFTGLRPGEKLYEEIFHGAEPPLLTERKGILAAAPRPIDADELRKELSTMEAACRTHDVEALLAILRRLVPEFQPGGEAVATDSDYQPAE